MTWPTEPLRAPVTHTTGRRTARCGAPVTARCGGQRTGALQVGPVTAPTGWAVGDPVGAVATARCGRSVRSVRSPGAVGCAMIRGYAPVRSRGWGRWSTTRDDGDSDEDRPRRRTAIRSTAGTIGAPVRSSTWRASGQPRRLHRRPNQRVAGVWDAAAAGGTTSRRVAQQVVPRAMLSGAADVGRASYAQCNARRRAALLWAGTPRGWRARPRLRAAAALPPARPPSDTPRPLCVAWSFRRDSLLCEPSPDLRRAFVEDSARPRRGLADFLRGLVEFAACPVFLLVGPHSSSPRRGLAEGSWRPRGDGAPGPRT
ncbi:hypothetical protein EHYA_09305 [Embleya hyalina]|uniref:Uncharacterized protein n=1 Tax=Embleya hyalina TaxID=516124 RepID=A0A401Z3W5_9ACTN|nr:hypothetical protein EHYA_09305 [Embleya hyalina]